MFVSTNCSAACVLVTHDGGLTWHRADVPEIGQLVMGTRSAYSLTDYEVHPIELIRNTIGSSP